MKCTICGMNYETEECPNCAVERALYASSQNAGRKTAQFKSEAEFDAYMEKEEDKKLEKGVDRWLIAFWIFLVLGILTAVIEVVAVGMGYTIGISISNTFFILTVLCLLFWYLGDIRRQLIILNKKR